MNCWKKLDFLNWQYKWKRCSKKKCCKQCGQVKFMGTMTKWPVQKHNGILKSRHKTHIPSRTTTNKTRRTLSYVYVDSLMCVPHNVQNRFFMSNRRSFGVLCSFRQNGCHVLCWPLCKTVVNGLTPQASSMFSQLKVNRDRSKGKIGSASAHITSWPTSEPILP